MNAEPLFSTGIQAVQLAVFERAVHNGLPQINGNKVLFYRPVVDGSQVLRQS